jgi:hypothetical protein
VGERIENLEQEIKAANNGGAEIDDRLPGKLQDQNELKATVEEALRALAAAEREQMHAGDPDARMMKGGTAKRLEFAYNAQAVCDATHARSASRSVQSLTQSLLLDRTRAASVRHQPRTSSTAQLPTHSVSSLTHLGSIVDGLSLKCFCGSTYSPPI